MARPKFVFHGDNFALTKISQKKLVAEMTLWTTICGLFYKNNKQ